MRHDKSKVAIATLAFHDVCDDARESGMQRPEAMEYRHTRAMFAAHLDEIEGSRSQVTTVRNWRETILTRRLMMTFDDGGKSAVFVGDELCRRGWRGHFFVITSLVGRPGFLDRSEIQYLHSCGHVIGSHSHTHPEIFKALAMEEMEKEWRVSCEILSDVIGEPCEAASIPGGDSSRRVYQSAERCGLRFLFTSEPRLRPRLQGRTWILGRACLKRNTPVSRTRALANFEGWRREQLVRGVKVAIRTIFYPAYKIYADRVAKQPMTHAGHSTNS